MAKSVWRLLRARPDAVPAARHSIEQLGVAAATNRIAELLVSELVTNAVRHGQPEHDACVLLDARVEKDQVVVEVCDEGTGGEPTITAADPLEPGGLGLRLVDELAADWGTRRNEIRCVWFRLPASA